MHTFAHTDMIKDTKHLQKIKNYIFHKENTKFYDFIDADIFAHIYIYIFMYKWCYTVHLTIK